MPIPVAKSGNKLVVGRIPNETSRLLLRQHTPDSDTILDNLDALNEEIDETREAFEAPPPPEEDFSVPEPRRSPAAPPRPQPRRPRPPEPEPEPEMDLGLDAALEEVEERLSESKPKQMKDEILDLLRQAPGAPSEAQLQAWKRDHGGVHVMAFGEGEVYCFTHLKRGQWKRVKEAMGKVRDTQQGADLEDELKVKVVQACMLFPAKMPLEMLVNSRAGLIDALYEVIMLQSYFLTPDQALALTVSL